MISQDFIHYWDEWHREWYSKASRWTPSSNQSLEKVGDWNVPSFIGDDKCTPSWEFLPEPYWGNPRGKLEAIFLNINPGLGGEGQNISKIKSITDAQHPIQDYKISYSRFISRINNYSTSKKVKNDYYRKSFDWWDNNRVGWARKVLDIPALTINQVFGAELAPWHTKGTSPELTCYIRAHSTPLRDHIFEPLLKLANGIVNDDFKNTVICRGVDIARAIEVIYPNYKKKEVSILHENSPFYRANTYQVSGISIIVFIGQGSFSRTKGMPLPDKTPVNIENCSTSSLRDMIARLK